MIKAIAFDLDDTLLDTSGILAPRATRDAFDHLLRHGLKLSLDECEKLRLQMILTHSHRDVFEKLARDHGTEDTLAALADTICLFYEPAIPAHLPLMEGARQNLDELKRRYPLFLVTAGNEKAQRQKAAALGITSDFQKIFIVDSIAKKRKKDAFLEIIRQQNIQPAELLCIGNSISSEITDALNIGATACYFEFGENRGHISDLPRTPHYHVRHHSELIATCRL